MPVVIRKANEKSPRQIHDEIRRAQSVQVPSGAASIEHRTSSWLQSVFFRTLPSWLRDLLFWRWLFGSAERVKRTMGTVMVSATGMMAPGVLAWGIPMSVHPLAVSVGGIAKRSTLDGEADILGLTLVFDHSVTDGAPFARFVRRLHELMTQPDLAGSSLEQPPNRRKGHCHSQPDKHEHPCEHPARRDIPLPPPRV
jgi:hypothetical protein